MAINKRLLTEADVDNLVKNEWEGHPAVKNPSIQRATKICINNAMRSLNEASSDISVGQENTTRIDTYTPVAISLIRRTLPTLIGPEIIGTQALTAPTGRIFVQRVYGYDINRNWGETWSDAPSDPRLSAGRPTYKQQEAGWDPVGSDDPNNLLDITKDEYGAPDADTFAPYETKYDNLGRSKISFDDPKSNIVEGMGWAQEQLGMNIWPEMAFGIDAIDVSVKSRALKGRITTEVIDDLKLVHKIDAVTELSNILESEIVAEIDREIVSRVYYEAMVGAQNCSTPGTFDLSIDADGRWTAEKVISLLIQIEREATIIAQKTRRGRGNFIITSPEVAAYLSTANLVSTLIQNAEVTAEINPVGVSYYGKLAGRYKLFVDPYMSGDNGKHILVVGFKGTTESDSGLIYCPYIPVQMYEQIGTEDFGKRIGIKSRYALVSNPYYCKPTVTTDGLKQYSQMAVKNTNAYFRKFLVDLGGFHTNP